MTTQKEKKQVGVTAEKTKGSQKTATKKLDSKTNLTGRRSRKNPKTFSAKSMRMRSGGFGNFKAQKPQIKVGYKYVVKISSLTKANLGLNEFTYGFPIFIGGLQETTAGLGDLVQIQILSIAKKQLKGRLQKYAVSKVVKVVKKAKTAFNPQINAETNVLANNVTVTITKVGLKGTYVAQGANINSKFFIYGTNTNKRLTIGDKVSVKVTKATTKYLFAKVVNNSAPVKAAAQTMVSLTNSTNVAKEGAKLTVVLPKKAKRYLKHIVFQIGSMNKYVSAKFLKANLAITENLPTILFVKPTVGAKLGDKVQIQIVKAYAGGPLKKVNIIIAKIVDINPISSTTKKAIIKEKIQQMLNSGMHYGEKAVRCDARMKNYVMYSRLNEWGYGTRTNSAKKNGADSISRISGLSQTGSQKRPIIKKGRNIINLFKTRRCLTKALAQLTKYAAKGKTFLFVGTKKAASGLIARASLFSKKAFFVNTRWLGGMLTNWKTIFKSISKISPILKEKQAIIKDILAKRQSIKSLLIEKAFILKKKSKLVVKKGKQLVQKFAKSQTSVSIFEKSQKLVAKRKQLLEKGQTLLEKRQLLLQKRKQLVTQTNSLYEKALKLVSNSKELFSRASVLRKQLRELKALLQVSQQLQKLKQTTKQLYTVSYNTGRSSKYQELSTNANSFVIPNPPQDLLTKIVLFIKNAEAVETSNVTKKDASATSKVLVLTKLLNNVAEVNTFAASIKRAIKVLVGQLQVIKGNVSKLQDAFKVIVNQMQTAFKVKNDIIAKLRLIKQTLTSQRNIIRVIKKKFKQISSQKNLLQFLPKLRYLPTPSEQLLKTVQVLMKKVVDPKLKYPIDSLYDSKLRSQTKKVAAMRKKKWQRLEKYLGGISNINFTKDSATNSNLPLVAIIIGQQEEMNAVRECKKLGIKMFHVVDTNCNPGLADHFIPANDDSRNSIKFVLTQFLTRIRLAQKLRKVALRNKFTK